MDRQILDLFRQRKNDFISGEELGKTLGISRQALFKHIEKLREEGYEIVAQPHSGYQLLSPPDRLIPDEIAAGLKTRIVGRKIYAYAKVDSTNDIAKGLAIAGADEGTVVFAEEQNKGRGRLGRKWLSLYGESILFSFILRPPIEIEEAPKVTLLTAVALAQAIRKASGLTCLIRWPNDLVVAGRKVGGILTEIDAETGSLNFLVVGAGINVNNSRKSLPPGATSLKEEGGRRFSRIELARRFLEEIDFYYSLFKKSGFAPALAEWKNLSATLGKRVSVTTRHGKIEGQAVGLAKDAALLVRLDSGFQEKISAGDVLLLR